MSPTPSSSSPAANPGGLTDEQLVGQLFVEYAYGASATSVSAAHAGANRALYGVTTPAQVVTKFHLGGVILIGANNLDPARSSLWSDNVDNAAQIRGLTAGLQRAAHADSGVGLLIATDQEGGNVQRIRNGVDPRPAQADIGDQSPATITCGYFTLGSQLRALGLNQDYAPVADVLRVGSTVIGTRSFGPDPNRDATDVAAAVKGLQAAGVLATLKHWPGHGGVTADSHYSLPALEQTVAQWRAIDRIPFAGSAKSAASVMVGFLAFPALDRTGTPAPFSSTLVDGALRRDLGYGGLVVTDSLWMQPARAQGTAGQAAIKAIRAGVDMLLMSPDLPHAYADVLRAVRADPAFRAKVQAAVTRILAAKQLAGRPPVTPSGC